MEIEQLEDYRTKSIERLENNLVGVKQLVDELEAIGHVGKIAYTANGNSFELPDFENMQIQIDTLKDLQFVKLKNDKIVAVGMKVNSTMKEFVEIFVRDAAHQVMKLSHK